MDCTVSADELTEYGSSTVVTQENVLPKRRMSEEFSIIIMCAFLDSVVVCVRVCVGGRETDKHGEKELKQLWHNNNDEYENNRKEYVRGNR